MMIKAIETKYKGYRFRSRLEARWAVFFDACGYNWDYESEGYALPCGTYYLPDFKVWGEDSNGDYNVFLFEVKPSEGGVFDEKVNAFQKTIWDMSDSDMHDTMPIEGYGDYIILDGTPERKLYHGTLPFNGVGGRQWLVEPWYRDRPSFHDPGESYGDICKTLGLIDDGEMTPVDYARSARFEHGENGSSITVRTSKNPVDINFTPEEEAYFLKKHKLKEAFLSGKKCHYEGCNFEPINIGDFHDMPIDWQKDFVENCNVEEVEKYCIPVCNMHYHEKGHDGYDYMLRYT